MIVVDTVSLAVVWAFASSVAALFAAPRFAPAQWQSTPYGLAYLAAMGSAALGFLLAVVGQRGLPSLEMNGKAALLGAGGLWITGEVVERRSVSRRDSEYRKLHGLPPVPVARLASPWWLLLAGVALGAMGSFLLAQYFDLHNATSNQIPDPRTLNVQAAWLVGVVIIGTAAGAVASWIQVSLRISEIHRFADEQAAYDRHQFLASYVNNR